VWLDFWERADAPQVVIKAMLAARCHMRLPGLAHLGPLDREDESLLVGAVGETGELDIEPRIPKRSAALTLS
jgi:hypothetical protein